jgi:hypothetical protein
MNFIGGLILLSLSVAMLLFARANRTGEPRVFLRNWIIAQMYAISILVIGVAGVGVIILNWPF